MNLLTEYPKAIASLVVGVLVTVLTGVVGSDYLSPANVNAAQIIIGGAATLLLGRYTRLPKSEAVVIDKLTTDGLQERDHSTND